MVKGQDVKNSIWFKMYILIISIILVIPVLYILPDHIQTFIYKPIFDSQFYLKSSPEIQSLLDVSAYAFLIIGFISGLLAGVLLKKKNIYELLGLLIGLMLPKDKKYWGRIADQNTNKSLPFARINLYSYENSEKTLLSTTVSDLDGRYRLHVDTQNQNNLYLEVLSEGYKPYLKRISLQYLDKVSKVISETIYMVSINSNENEFTHVLNAINSKLYNIVFLLVLVIPFFHIVINIFFSIINPNFLNFALVVVFSITAYWNARVINDRSKITIGKILDVETMEPIQSALVTLIQDDEKKLVSVTNKDGIIKLDVKPGDYKIQVTAQNYTTTGGTGDMGMIKIGADGYLQQDLMMQKSNQSLESTGMINPFA